MKENLPQLLNPLKRIWWLASYPKSGNTWARYFVNAYASGRPIKLNTVYQYATDDLRAFTFQQVAAKALDKFTPLDVLYYRSAVLLHMIRQAELSGMDLCLKTHNARASVENTALIPSPLTMGATYIVRDPRDVCLSFARHLNKTVDETIEYMGRVDAVSAKTGVEDKGLWHYLSTWSAHVQSWTEGNKAFPVQVVRYEDMLNEPELAFKRVLNGIGLAGKGGKLEVDEDRLRFAIEQTSFERMQRLEQDGGFCEQRGDGPFFAHGKAGRWREVLTTKQVQAIETAHAEFMTKLEYELEETEKWHLQPA